MARATSRGGADGIGTYSERLLGELRRIPGLSLETFEFAAPRRLLGPRDWGNYQLQAGWAWAMDGDFPLAARRSPAPGAVVHATDHYIPKLARLPVVATIHDAIPLSHPESVRYSLKPLRHAIFRRAAGWAAQVITVSEYSKQEIVRWFGIPPEKITVTPLGVDAMWHKGVPAGDSERARTRYGLPERYFLFVGTLQPRKNVRRIIDAHKSLPPQLRREIPLVVAGRHGWSCEREVSELESCADGTMRWLRYVAAEDLLPVFKRASALVWPSLNEGFGLPVLEAFAAGLPVVTSNTTSLPEVAGGAALLVSPENTGQIAEAMRAVVADEALCADLRSLGRARAAEFTWDRTARLTVDVYRKAIDSSA